MATAVYYAESLGTSTTSSTSPQDKVTASVSVVSGRKYLILGSATARIGTGSSARNVAVQLWDDTGGAELALVNSSFADVSSDPAVSLGAVYVAGSTGTVDFQIRYYRGGAINTTVIESARLLVIELGDDDQYVTPSDYARSSTSYGDAATLTFTPPSSGDYIFLFGGSPDNFPLGVKFLAPDGTSVDEVVDGPSMRSDISSVASWGGAWVQNLAASSQTAKIQFRSTDGVSHTLSDIFIVALRASDLSNVQYSQDNTPAGGTQTSYTNSETLGATGMATASRDTVAIGAFSVKGTSTSVNSLVQITEGGSPLIESTHRPAGVGTRDTQAALVALKSAAAGASITYDIDRRSSSGTSTTTVNFAALVVFEIASSGVSDISGAAAGAATVAGDLNGTGKLAGTSPGAATVSGDLNGQGRLSGASAGSATATGDLNGTGDLAGTSAGDATATGRLLGAGALVGTGAGTSTGAGTLTGAGRLSGASAGAATATGSLVADGALAGTAAGTSTASGQLLGVGALSGAAAGTSTATGSLVAILPASGTAAGTSTATGTISGAGALIGVASGAATVSGDLNGDGDLAGTAAGTSTATGHVADAGSLRGSAHGSSAASGALSEGRTLGEILAAWGIRNGWQPPGAAVALGKLRGRAAGGSSATGKIAGLQPKTRRPRQAAPAPTARKASPARPSPARKPQIDRLIPMPGPLSGRAIGRHVVATGAVVGIGALAGTAAGAEGASVGTLKAIAEARGTGRGQGAARGAVAAIYGDTLDDEEALAMILAAA